MISKKIRLLDFDGSVAVQKNIAGIPGSEIVDLKDLGPAARLWVSKANKKKIEDRISGSDKNAVTFLGSGDYHHISNILINQFDEDISVIDFDFHPDWTMFVPWLSCGSWVKDTLKRKNILKFIMMGVSSGDISGFSLYSGNFKALKNDRVEIYPYSHRPSRLYFRNVPDNISIEVSRSLLSSRINWNELKGKDLVEFFLHVIRRLPTKKVYISIDKDCLKKEYALTNWEEGRLDLADLLEMIRIIKDNCDIVGADICGDYSSVSVKGLFKKIVSDLDHPKDYSAKAIDENLISEINSETSLKILSVL